MSITLWQYYLNLSGRIADEALKDVHTLSEWESRRADLRRCYMRSMGLEPLPPRCDLSVAEYGRFSGSGFQARKVAYQIMPACWATACVYLPDPLPPAKCPGVLYACGHKPIGIHGYQDHAVMWARRGYVCLIFDTIEQHDNPADHHGLYHGNRLDWISLGYSGAGGELWNSIRALDVLADRPEVDADRIGATGNSGGGALSYYLAVADDRVRAVASSCGVAVPKYTLANRNLLGHCDCIYYHNLHQKDQSEFAALIAPRPALYCFAKHDALFHPEEYRHLVARAKKVYALYGCEEKCELFDYPGPHGYQPESVQRINEWFDEHVSGRPHPEMGRAELEHEEKVTTVFNGQPPSPNHLALLPELLSPEGTIPLPQGAHDWPAIRDAAKAVLRKQVFHALDALEESLDVSQVGDWRSGKASLRRYRGTMGGMDLSIECWMPEMEKGPVLVGVANADEAAYNLVRRLADHGDNRAFVGVEPRGGGFTAYHPAHHRHLLRAAALTGLTPVMMMVHDLECVMKFLRELDWMRGKRVYLYGRADAGVACLYHAIFDDAVGGVVLENPPPSHRNGAYVPGILRVLDLPHALGLMAPRPVGIVAGRHAVVNTKWPQRVYARLGCPERLIHRTYSLKSVLDLVLAAGVKQTTDQRQEKP